MRIGIDARELCGQPTGVGRYLGGLLASWGVSTADEARHFILYVPQALTGGGDFSRFETRIVSGAGGTWWEQIDLPRAAARDRVNVLFCPAYTAPLLYQGASVVAIHDLSFAAHPEWFARREGMRRRWIAQRSAQNAHAVITISEFSRRELIARFRIGSAKIHVIPPGIARIKAGEPTTSAHDAHVLYVGSIFNRRHVPDLIRAFAPIARKHADAILTLVGDNRSYPREDLAAIIAREDLGNAVRWKQYITDTELAALYADARAFAFLSEYEGLGMTPLEALAAGALPVVLDTPVARESCRDAALYVPLGDIDAITQALEQILFDESTRQRLLSAAPAVLERYRWSVAASRTLDVLEQAADS